MGGPCRFRYIDGMESLESRLVDLTQELTFVGDWTDRYRLLVEWGEEAESLPEVDRLPEWEVSGCSSPLWLRVRWVDGRLEILGASPGILPRALVAIVTRLFQGLDEVTGQASELVDRLEFRRNLSPTRVLVLERMFDRALHCPRGTP